MDTASVQRFPTRQAAKRAADLCRGWVKLRVEHESILVVDKERGTCCRTCWVVKTEGGTLMADGRFR